MTIDIISNDDGYHVGRTHHDPPHVFFLHVTKDSIRDAYDYAKHESDETGESIEIVSEAVREQVERLLQGA